MESGVCTQTHGTRCASFIQHYFSVSFRWIWRFASILVHVQLI